MSLINDIITLQDLAENICDPSKCTLDPILKAECVDIRRVLKGLIELDVKCPEKAYNAVSAIVSRIEAKFKANKDLVMSFSLNVFLNRYEQWVKDIEANLVRNATLGDSSKPVTDLKVSFAQIAGAYSEKNAIDAAFIYPFLYPMLFPERVRGMLFYGPPGTGKTLIVKALVMELKTAILFAPDPASLKGKYEGETEKNIQAVYSSASAYLDNKTKSGGAEFAIIFIDEADSLLGAGREADASKQRTVNTFLQMIDGVRSDPRITTIAATNYPQTIDSAVLRRLQVKILVDLPVHEAREFLIRSFLSKRYSSPSIPLHERIVRLCVEEEDGKCETKFVSYTDYLSNLETYGGSGAITESGIQELCNRSGPLNTTAIRDLIGFVDSSEYNTQSISELGFTPSDLTTALNLAASAAAARAIGKDACYHKIKYGDKLYFVYDPTLKKGKLGKTDCTCEKLKENDRASIIAFNLTTNDVLEALRNLPSSLKMSDYQAIKKFEQGKE